MKIICFIIYLQVGFVLYTSLLQVSGHKSVDNVNAYTDLAEEECLALGRVLGRPQGANYNTTMARLDTTQVEDSPFTLCSLFLHYRQYRISKQYIWKSSSGPNVNCR